jgi:hypothetical protein
VNYTPYTNLKAVLTYLLITLTRHTTQWLGTKGEVERDYQSPPGPAGSIGLIGLIGNSSIGEIGGIGDRIDGRGEGRIDRSGEMGTIDGSMDEGVIGVIGKSEIGVIGIIGEMGELMFSSSVVSKYPVVVRFRL